MHWQPVALADLGHQQAIDARALQVWWWPEALQPQASNRRERTDAILRTLLACHVAMAPAGLLFGRESRGRPHLLHAGAPDFNLSDTQGGCVVAIAGSGRVGIDIERCERSLPATRLAARWFAADEAERLRALDAESARRAFLRLWTAKEASCKATGTGIYGQLAAWRFAMEAEDASPQPLAIPTDAGSVAEWRFHRLAPVATHTVALAVRGNFMAPRGYTVVP